MISKPHKCIAILAKNVTLTVDGNHHYQTALLFHNSCTFTEKLKGELTRADGPAVASGGAGGATFRCEVLRPGRCCAAWRPQFAIPRAVYLEAAKGAKPQRCFRKKKVVATCGTEFNQTWCGDPLTVRGGSIIASHT